MEYLITDRGHFFQICQVFKVSALEEYRKFVPKSARKNIITIIFVAGMLLGLYLSSGAIYRIFRGYFTEFYIKYICKPVPSSNLSTRFNQD